MSLARILLHIYERALRDHRARVAYHELARQTHAQAAKHHRERAVHYEAECARLRLRLTTPEAVGKRVEA